MTVSVQVRTSRSGGWRRAGLWLLAASALVALALAAFGVAVWDGLSHWGDAPGGVSVTINGENVTRAFDISGWPPAHKVVLVVVLALALLAALLVVPMALLFGAVALTVLVLGAVALPLLIGFVALAALFSPLWLLMWWLVVRSRRPRAPAPAADTIDA